MWLVAFCKMKEILSISIPRRYFPTASLSLELWQLLIWLLHALQILVQAT